jgi:hypothetical protein
MRRFPAGIVPHIRNGTLGATVAAAMAAVDAFFGMNHQWRRRFGLVINAMGALVHTGAAFNACEIINNWIPILCHSGFLLIPTNIEKR